MKRSTATMTNEAVILNLLFQSPDLYARAIAQRAKLSIGGIYTTLQRLQKRDLVCSKWQGRLRIYKLTFDGNQRRLKLAEAAVAAKRKKKA
jgi:DNA-binding PadR family transcriptional regulator